MYGGISQIEKAPAARLQLLPACDRKTSQIVCHNFPDSPPYFHNSRLKSQFSVGCGDPHYAHGILEGMPVSRDDLWGLFEVDCATGQYSGFRDELADKLRRPLLRAAPGTITSMNWYAVAQSFEASGAAATAKQKLLLFLPDTVDRASVSVTGLDNIRYVDAAGDGEFLIANAKGGAWELSLEVQ